MSNSRWISLNFAPDVVRSSVQIPSRPSMANRGSRVRSNHGSFKLSGGDAANSPVAAQPPVQEKVQELRGRLAIFRTRDLPVAFISFGTDGRILAGFEGDALDFVALRLNSWLSENIDDLICSPAASCERLSPRIPAG
jgi:hypothetical protein